MSSKGMITWDLKKKDRNGETLRIGDVVELYDWTESQNGEPPEMLGVVTLIWDDVEGRVSCSPCLVDDPYDFWQKALPHCKKVRRSQNGTVQEIPT